MKIGFMLMKSEGDVENHYCAFSYGKAFVDCRIENVKWDVQSLIIPRIPKKDDIFRNKTDYFLPYEYGKTVDDVVDLPIILHLISNFTEKKELLDGIEIPKYKQGILSHFQPISEKLARNEYVFFSVFRYHMFFHIYIAMLVKRLNPKCIITFGGPQMELSPLIRKVLLKESFINHICIGDVEVNLMDVLTGKAKKLNENYIIGQPEVPDYTDISTKLYNNTVLIKTSKNCTHKCAYCPAAKKMYNIFTLEYVERCLKRYKNNKVYLTDPLLNPTKNRFDSLLDLLTVYNFPKKYTMWLHFYGLTEQSVKKLGKLNPDNVWISIDTASERLRKKYQRLYSDNCFQMLEVMIDSQIKPWVPYIVGMPGENEDDFSKTLESILELHNRFGDRIGILLFPYIYLSGAELLYNNDKFEIETTPWNIEGYEEFPQYYKGVPEEVTRWRIQTLNGVLGRW
jgi:hypothetical protein